MLLSRVLIRPDFDLSTVFGKDSSGIEFVNWMRCALVEVNHKAKRLLIDFAHIQKLRH